MRALLPHPSRLTDRAVISGWMLLMITGQLLLPFESQPLEWLAIGWLAAGFFLVRKMTCLPLLLLTCPVFQCEPHRAWAWGLPLLAGVLLLRILWDRRLSRRDVLWVIFWGVLVAWLSWPANAGGLLVKLRAFPRHEVLAQWFRPEASWSIFPFRASFDRALAAALCAALFLAGRYVSTPRLWRALFATGLLALFVTEAAALIPWHQPHRFLGTTNYASFGPYLLHGAGYNAAYLPMLLAGALAWFVAPLGRRYRWAHVGLVLLLPLLWFLIQRSMGLLAVLLPMVGAALILHAWLGPRHRPRLRHRLALFLGSWRQVAIVALSSLVLSSAWLFATGITKADSALRQRLAADLSWENSRWANPVPYGPATPSGPTPEMSPAAVSRPPEPVNRVQQILARIDPARAHMWSVGMSHVWDTGVWRGEGAGTWAAFHRSQPRPSRLYFAHMHNTYLDLAFEYGLIPVVLMGALFLIGCCRLVFGRNRQPRIWLLYFAGMGIVALGQYLLFSFFSLCLLIPGVLILLRTGRGHNNSGNSNANGYK